MDLMTIQVSRHRTARYHKIEFVDTTVKSGNQLFAPTWDMVMGHKRFKAGDPDGMTDEEYTHLYRQRMIQSWKEHRAEWEEFLRRPEPIAIACYCRPGEFCHRYLLKDIFQELCGKLNIPFQYYGELI